MSTKKLLKDKPVFFKYLDVSTEHITPNDDTLLRNSTSSSELNVTPHGYGYYIYSYGTTEYDYKKLQKEGYSKGFITLLKWAKEVKANYIQLDRDGTSYIHLPTYDW